MNDLSACLTTISARVLLVTTLQMAGSAVGAAEAPAGLNLIPWPKHLTVEPGEAAVTPASRIVTRDTALLPLAQVLAGELARTMDITLAVAEGASQAGDIVLALDPKIAADQPIRTLRNREVATTTDGAYQLTAADTIEVAGHDYRAVAEGTSTLLQAMRKGTGGASVPRMRIKDWPHADYLSVMLDVARQNHPVKAVKQVVDLCRLYRVRYLHLHLTDDHGWTFPSTAYPQLGSRNTAAHGGEVPKVYTLAELTELVAYADARGVTLVPELNMPGHSEAALRSFPEVFDAINPATGKPVNMGCMNMANEQLYKVLDTLIGEMCAVFTKSPYFHIGTDEVQLGRLQLHPGYQEFMTKHDLGNEGELATYFVRQVNEMVARRGKKAIKWEGVADVASKDIILMTWDNGSRAAERYIAQGFTTITCPWVLGVPWEEWNMYACNGSLLKRTDPVLGSTLVMWELSAPKQVEILRGRIPQRQERTWGPDNRFTKAGWERRHNATDALAAGLLGIPPSLKWPVKIDTTLTPDGLQGPQLAVDDADQSTWFLSAAAPRKGDHFSLGFATPARLIEIEVFTGTPDGRNPLHGELQVSADGSTFKNAGVIDVNGYARFVSDEGALVRTLRLTCTADQAEPVAIRAIRLSKMVEIDSVVTNPNETIGADNVAVCVGNAGLNTWGKTSVSVINRGHDFEFLTGGGNALELAGFFRGTGRFHVAQGSDMPVTLSGKVPNPFHGTWLVHQGILALAKPAGITALAGKVIVGGGKGAKDAISWRAPHQVDDAASVELLLGSAGAARLLLNGCDEKFGTLSMVSGTRIVTDGNKKSGNLVLDTLVLDGKPLPQGIYAGGCHWIEGNGLVTVGAVKRVELSGALPDPAKALRPGDFAVLTGPVTLALNGGTWENSVDTGAHTLSLVNKERGLRVTGFIAGLGELRVQAEMPVEFTGPTANAHTGSTRLTGTIGMGKADGVATFPGAVVLDTSDGHPALLAWRADDQLGDRTILTVRGTGPAVVDLAGHRERLEKIELTESSRIRTKEQGRLNLRQLMVNGKPVAPGSYTTGQPWLEGNGTVVVDPRMDVSGVYNDPNNQIGVGNLANLVGDTTFGYSTRSCAIPVINNGHKLTFDSGGGNEFHYTGTISGTGDVWFRMGPSYTNHKDVPMRLGGAEPNTLRGHFHVKMGRVQLEKPEGVIAISGDVTVGGQGFNDCLRWKSNEQVADTASVTLIESGNAGAAYLALDGHRETVSSLTLDGACRILTDDKEGQAGELTVKSLTARGKSIPAGTYTAKTHDWIVGNGRVLVRP